MSMEPDDYPEPIAEKGTTVASSKFEKLAAKVGSAKLAGWITNHEPKVKARADATRARHKLANVGKRMSGKGGY